MAGSTVSVMTTYGSTTPNNPVRPMPLAAKKAVTGMPGQSSAPMPELLLLRDGLLSLTRLCSEALGKAVQHYQGDDAWVIGPMPACGELAEDLEAQARSYLANSQLSMHQIDEIATLLKTTGDLRAIFRSGRHAAQMAWLFRQEGNTQEIMALIRRVGEASLHVGLMTSEALEKGDPKMARNAALMYRHVDDARCDAENYLRGDIAQYAHTPMQIRMALAGIWFMTIAGESMARIAARAAS
jgi:hypothetical protein